MTISEILNEHIDPFEIEDEKLCSLFSFFLHLAPTIDSSSSRFVPQKSLIDAWNQFVISLNINNTDYYFYRTEYITDTRLAKYGLTSNDSVTKSKKGFTCCFKDADNNYEINCFLRHIRNSIAHSNVYVLIRGRKYLLFDDYNRKGHRTARILISQTDLKCLRRQIEKKR